MLVYLVALVIVPALGMPAFAMLFTRDRLQDAEAARRTAHGMEQLVDFEELRSALRDEALEAGVRAIALRFSVSVDDLQGVLGHIRIRSIPDSRRATDETLGRMRTELNDVTLDELATSLDQARAVVDDAMAGSKNDPDAIWTVYLRYNEAYEMINGAQRESLQQVVTGSYGEASRNVLLSLAETEALRNLAEALFHQMSALQGLATAPGATEQQLLVDDMEVDRRLSETLAERLPTLVTQPALADWDELSSKPDYREFHEFVDDLVNTPSGDAAAIDPGLSIVSLPGFLEASTAVVPLSESVGELMSRSVARGVAAAEHDEQSAVNRAQVAVIATAGLLVVTFLALVLVGGSMRRELNQLAEAAGRLRTGRLQPVPVEGPREIASVAEALNDAVANLNRVSEQAEMLAAGRFDDLAKLEPVPGELGTAVHASVDNVVEVVRELDRLRGELAHQATHDGLTGLVNRAEAERLLVEAVEEAKASGDHVAVLFVDLDGFKHVNDSLSHAAGDYVLTSVAERMTACVRPGDTVSRLGGDEFLVILKGQPHPVTAEGAIRVAERICVAIGDPIHLEGVTLVTAASIGIALTTHATDPHVLRSHADTAMYRAKAAGLSGVAVYDERLDASGLPRRPTPGSRAPSVIPEDEAPGDTDGSTGPSEPD